MLLFYFYQSTHFKNKLSGRTYQKLSKPCWKVSTFKPIPKYFNCSHNFFWRLREPFVFESDSHNTQLDDLKLIRVKPRKDWASKLNSCNHSFKR